MTAVETSRMALSGGSRGAAFRADPFGALKAWNDARRTRRALNRLSDRELADIGLTRDGIAAASAQMRA